jgi:cytochrome c heme-lyase
MSSCSSESAYNQGDCASSPPNNGPLPTHRTASEIPRGVGGEYWEYPSAETFSKALARKGEPVENEQIPAMLAVHNALNDAVWAKVVRVEAILNPGAPPPTLVRFLGRPDRPSPTALWRVLFRGRDPPFDRHDWHIQRFKQNLDNSSDAVPNGRLVRYVIDFYSAANQESAFEVHIRPAIDGPSSLIERARLWLHRKFPRD